MKASTLVRTLVWVSFASVFTGIAPAASNDVQVSVEGVTDNRVIGNSQGRCSVQLHLSGGDVLDAFGIHDVRVTRAEDDTGTDLRLGPEQNAGTRRFIPNNNFYPGGFNPPQSTHSVDLLSPPRTARFIKLLEGEAELLFPTPENGGMVVIKNFLAHPGEPYASPSLTESGVTIIYLGKEGGEDAPATTNTKDAQTSASPAVGSSPTPRHLPFLRHSNQPRGLRFTVNDPKNHLVDMFFVDSYGRPIGGMVSFYNGDSRTYQVQNEISTNSQLRIFLATPGATRTVPFKLENIDLP